MLNMAADYDHLAKAVEEQEKKKPLVLVVSATMGRGSQTVPRLWPSSNSAGFSKNADQTEEWRKQHPPLAAA
jgi:hypothetical protein